MDNSNNQSLPNNSAPPFPNPTPASPSLDPSQVVNPSTPTNLFPSQNPASSIQTPPLSAAPAAVNGDPLPVNPLSSGDQLTSIPTQSNINPQPSDPTVTISPLDNPWNAPIQPPPIDGSNQNPQPTWVPNPSDAEPISTPPLQSTLSVSPEDLTPQVNGQTEPAQMESAPTDLSHLISNNNSHTEPAQNNLNPSSAAGTLVLPASPPTPDVPTTPLGEQKGLPKWSIGVGIGLLIIVAGASAYFILGIGQPSKDTTSLPAQVTKTSVKTPPPIPSQVNPTPNSNPAAATPSANFGQLQNGSTPTQQATGSSVIDRLRQRNQQTPTSQ
ncbi:hypothetical protein HYW41_01535 [Candidatus Daviesbacteria bacterium]|nr:hypothetical protein [Candidatus Daviesbacteria bacterium]